MRRSPTKGDAEGGHNLIVGALSAHGGVRQEKDAGMREPAGHLLPDRNQAFQLISFPRRQRIRVLGHRILRDSVKGRAIPSGCALQITYQS
jgi:hypothetical protein